MAYSGPQKIVILGGGIAGLAVADAISEALEPIKAAGQLPADLEITLVEGDEQVGGRAMTWKIEDTDPDEHPHRPLKGHTPHGIHFTWHSYRHFLRWTRDAQAHFSPTRPTSTYCSWLAAPDVPQKWHARGRIVALHVCDPQEPNTAWDPRTRAILEAFKRNDFWVGKFEDFVRTYLVKDVEVDDWLSFLDILFDEDNLSPQLRWGMFFGPAFAASIGQVETSQELKELLGGRAPQDVEVSELITPFFESIVMKRLVDANVALGYITQGPTSIAPIDALYVATRGAAFSVGGQLVKMIQGVLDTAGVLSDAAKGAFELIQLIARDTRQILDEAATYDPKQSAYLKNLYKAAFSSPYAFDLATALRDTQFGFRNFQSAKLQVFDGDDAQAIWNTVRNRILARGTVNIRTNTWAKKLVLEGDHVKAVEITNSAVKPKRPVSTIDPYPKGDTKETLPADVVVSSLLPVCLKPLLPPGNELRISMNSLSRYLNETVNLQLFFPRKMELPFVDPPNPAETPPFSISNLEGIYTILVDLKRAWHAATFKAIKLDAAQVGDFDGTAWELVGSWGDVFTHDMHAPPGRYQWPLGIQHALARKAHDPDELEAWSIDARDWVFDTGSPGWIPPPPFGEVKRDPAVRKKYFERWVNEVGPLVVQQTLRQLAALPGLRVDDSEHLKEVGDAIARVDANVPLKFVFTRSCHAENKFFSAEPHLFELRPHARYETSVKGLWCCGDWTRNGLNVQAMEGALVSGLQSAAGVIEMMRAGGLENIRGPRIEPDCLPNGGWDPGP
jgi:hypothetical protein